jgi:hypothetical protein
MGGYARIVDPWWGINHAMLSRREQRIVRALSVNRVSPPYNFLGGPARFVRSHGLFFRGNSKGSLTPMSRR